MARTTKTALCLITFAVVFGAVYMARVAGSQRMVNALLKTALNGPRTAYEGVVVTDLPYRGRMVSAHLRVSYTPGKGTQYELADSSSNTGLSTASCCWIPTNGLTKNTGETALLAANYHPAFAGYLKVAGRDACVIILTSKWQGRPQVTLAIDKQTGIILKTTKNPPDGSAGSVTRFTSITFKNVNNTHPAHGDSAIAMLEPNQIAQAIGFHPKRPSFVPKGFHPTSQGIYHCPCGCGMRSAVLQYCDGLASYSVFQTSEQDNLCGSAECKSMDSPGACQVGVMDGKIIAGAKRGKTIVAVTGDLIAADARKVTLSVPE